jgi:hypothetical protein
MKKLFHSAFFFISLILTSHVASSQLIKEEFNDVVFSDQFDGDREQWRNMSTSDNLFMTQEGEYLLRRKNVSNGYSIFPKWKDTLTSFSLSASMKIEESKSEESAIGLIFMAQEDASGAFVFELNAKGQYRLKQLVGLSFKLLTGDVKSSGWVETDALKKTGEYNTVEIKSSKRNYDIYVNEKYLLSFTEIAYKSGDIGISIGPATKARIDYIVVKGSITENGKPTAASAGAKSTGVNDTSGSDIILRLSDQVADLKIENQMLRDSISTLNKKLKEKAD